MTEMREAFPEIDSLDPISLQNLEKELISKANGDWRNLDDESLTRLWKITRALRRKAAHAGVRKSANGSSPKAKKEKNSDKSDSDDLI